MNYQDKIKKHVESYINVEAALKLGEDKFKKKYEGRLDVEEAWKVIESKKPKAKTSTPVTSTKKTSKTSKK